MKIDEIIRNASESPHFWEILIAEAIRTALEIDQLKAEKAELERQIAERTLCAKR